MVDFSSPKRRKSRGNLGRGLFVVSLIIIGVVGYALLEEQIHNAFAGAEPEAGA